MKRNLLSLIEREKKICDMAEHELKSRCRIFEEKYNLSSDDFYMLFLEGKMGDDEDFYEWKALIEGIKDWKQTKDNLKELVND